MKFLSFFFLLPVLAYAGGDKAIILDYMQIHKPFMSVLCIDEKTQQEMDQCGERSLIKARSKMNALLEGLKTNHKTAEPSLFEYLTSSQLIWESHMDTSCKVETYYSKDGSGFNSIWNYCLETKINERISYLSWMMENP